MTNGRNAFLGFLAGVILGVPASYFMQSGVVRAKLSLGAYIGHLPELVSKYPQDMLPPVLISCAVLGIAGWLVGGRLRSTPQ